MIRKKIIGLFIVVLSILGLVSQGHLYGQLFKEDFAAEPMVDTQVKYDEGMILFKIELDKNYHITDLKNNFFKIEAPENEYLKVAKVEFPKGTPYADELVFKGAFEVPVYVKVVKEIPAGQVLKFKLSYQVCQESPRELCYPPAEKDIDVKFSQAFKTVEGAGERGKRGDESYSQWVERIVKQELERKSFLLFLLVFAAGFLTSFTPCVYPVIPIVMGYIGTRSGSSKLKGFYLSIFFVLGLALVYSVFGVIAATTGTMMGLSFQNPLVVIIIAAIFILMGLSLAGLFEIPVPSSISSKVQSGHKSEIIGSLLVGGVSGIIAAPCVGPVLIALLSWISQTGNILLGFWLTFTFSLGLGVIFLIVGTFSGVVSAMPRGGNWMNYVKYFFALLLLGGGIYFLSTITAEWLDYLLWGIFLIAAAVFMGLLKPLEEDAGIKSKLFKILLALILFTGAFFFMKSLEMKYFPAKYSPVAVDKVHLPWLADLEEGKKVSLAENKIMMIDTYADWCVACKELDEYTFSTPEVSERLKGFVLVKLDFTKKSEANEALRKLLGIIGMPTVMFFNPEGKEIKRFSGFMERDNFLSFLDGLKTN
ncbi:MAG: protein-disulfide reductase DsbD [Candidatus Aminicenantes bacterium]|nr:protein-disulfide reductase DsbD [Candidatus Aminicenantes bacterium]